MEFTGRIKKILPVRTGTSANGEWKALPFIFEYFEHETDRWADSVLLETFDTKVIENLKEGMEVCIGFGHKAKEITKRDGSGTATINELRLYKMECVKAAPAPQTIPQPAAPTSQPQQGAEEGADNDDLPF